MEKQRGISITTSVMQFPYADCLVNLLDTPGHEDFSEDTYRTLTAVDCCLMVIDAAKGVEDRTRKLMEVTRLRDTPILTFMNKLDREVRDPMEVMDEVERELNIMCAPSPGPSAAANPSRGVPPLQGRDLSVSERSGPHHPGEAGGQGVEQPGAGRGHRRRSGGPIARRAGAGAGRLPEFDHDAFIAGEMTPVFFGTALGNFGVDHMLDGLTDWAPSPMPRKAESREVAATEEKFSGFVFKIQANMDPKHRDRIAFMRIVSGTYSKGMKMRHVRIGKDVNISDAVTFMAGDREQAEDAFAGDIIGLHNHGTIQIGDTFTQGEDPSSPASRTLRRNCSAASACATRSSRNSYSRGWCSSPKRAPCRCSARSSATISSWVRSVCCSST